MNRPEFSDDTRGSRGYYGVTSPKVSRATEAPKGVFTSGNRGNRGVSKSEAGGAGYSTLYALYNDPITRKADVVRNAKGVRISPLTVERNNAKRLEKLRADYERLPRSLRANFVRNLEPKIRESFLEAGR